MNDPIWESPERREQFPVFHLLSLILGLLIAAGAVASVDAPSTGRDASGVAQPRRAQIRRAYQPKIVRQPVTVYIVDSQLQAETLEQAATSGDIDDGDDPIRLNEPREYLIGGNALADEEVQQRADYMNEMNETSEASGVGTIFRIIDLRYRR